MFSKFATITCIPVAQESKILQSGRLNPIISEYAMSLKATPMVNAQTLQPLRAALGWWKGRWRKGKLGGNDSVWLPSFLIREVHQGTFRVRGWWRKQPEDTHSPCSVTGGQSLFLPNLALTHKVLFLTANFRWNLCDVSLPWSNSGLQTQEGTSFHFPLQNTFPSSFS